MIQAKKNLGQNWLIDQNIINKIIDKTKITKDTNVIEIGPGQGALTNHIIPLAKKVVAIEIDKDLCKLFNDRKDLTLICEDVLQIDMNKLIKEEFNNEDVIVISNLPYYITSKIIFKNLESKKIVKQVLMIQKEYGERMIANPGTKTFGRLSVGVQVFNEVNKITSVSRNSFSPRPNVDSMVVELLRKEENPFSQKEEEEFLKMTKTLFANKRKTIRNNLNNYLNNKQTTEDVLKHLNIPENKRAEQLPIETFVILFKYIREILS